MAINPELKKAVVEQDLLMVRVMLKNSMWSDPTFETFNEAIKYAEKNISNLYEKHDGEIFTEDKTKWNKELVAEQLAKCVDNFSRERILYLRRICRFFYANKIQTIETKRRLQAVQKSYENKKRKKVMMTGAGVAAVGLIAGSTVLTVAGVAVVGYGLLNNVDE